MRLLSAGAAPVIPYRITSVTVPAASLALVSLDDAKLALGIDPSDTSQDAMLTQQIDAVSRAINNYCDRVLAVQSYRDQIREACGFWGEPIITRQYPIVLDSGGVPLVTITEDGAALASTYYEVSPETGALYRLTDSAAASGWAAALLVVDYTAGFDPIPADIQGAAFEWLTMRWAAVGRDPALVREIIPDLITEQYQRGDISAIPAGTRDLLTPYRLLTV
jgi:hypothetical protein